MQGLKRLVILVRRFLLKRTAPAPDFSLLIIMHQGELY